jgi:hypothetical protein
MEVTGSPRITNFNHSGLCFPPIINYILILFYYFNFMSSNSSPSWALASTGGMANWPARQGMKTTKEGAIEEQPRTNIKDALMFEASDEINLEQTLDSCESIYLGNGDGNCKRLLLVMCYGIKEFWVSPLSNHTNPPRGR